MSVALSSLIYYSLIFHRGKVSKILSLIQELMMAQENAETFYRLLKSVAASKINTICIQCQSSHSLCIKQANLFLTVENLIIIVNVC